MIKIAQISDIHIYNNERFIEYQLVFGKLYSFLKKEKVELIVITGDLFQDKLVICNESKIFAADFLNQLSKIAPIRIIHGNHDLNVKNLTRINTVKTVVELIKNPDIFYMEETGFYDDPIFTEIVWAVHAHKYQDNNPWLKTDIEKDSNKTYISLYHDPISGYYNQKLEVVNKNSYRTLDEFIKSDFVMAGDIHIIQSHMNERFWYAGSMIQQNHGERLSDNVDYTTFHGGLIWEIDGKQANVKPFDIENEYNYITFVADINFDYDNIEFTHPKLNQNSNVRIKWFDYLINQNFTNEIKLRNYFKDKYGIKKVKFKKKGAKTNISETSTITESINIFNPETQRQLFIEYMTLNGIDSSLFNEVLELDEIVNKLLVLDFNTGITWSVKKIWLDNFKSYGDNIEIDLSDKAGIIQIAGSNQAGKTTILDAICYVLYNETLGTTDKKKLKHGDYRFINNKRKKDSCEVMIVIDINGELYTITRKTIRTFAKDKKTLSGCSTVVNYYTGDVVCEDNLLTGDSKSKTQKLIEDSIGTFDDFIRLVLTTADNLNELLTVKRADFIDTLSRDAGYDMFEKKQDNVKQHRKIVTKDFTNINIVETVKLITETESNIANIKNEISEFENDINAIENEIVTLIGEKDKTYKQLLPIDKDVLEFNLEMKLLEQGHLLNDIDSFQSKIKDIEILETEIKSYDETPLNDKQKQLLTINSDISVLEKKISETKYQIINSNKNMSDLTLGIEKSKNAKIAVIQAELNELNERTNTIKTEFTSALNTRKEAIKDEITTMTLESNQMNFDIQTKMAEAKRLMEDNKTLESSKICTECERVLEEEQLKIILVKIENNKNTINTIKEELKSINAAHQAIEAKIKATQTIYDAITNKDFSVDATISDKYKAAQKTFSGIKTAITDCNERIEAIKTNNVIDGELLVEKNSINDSIQKYNTEITQYEESISLLEQIKERVFDEINRLKTQYNEIQEKKSIIAKKSEFEFEIEKIKHNILVIEHGVEKYNTEKSKIEINKSINLRLSEIESQIGEKRTVSDEIKTKRTINLSKLTMFERDLLKYDSDKVKYEYQTHINEIFDIYIQCVHRDGLPTFLLKKSIDIINQELANLMENNDFIIFFDEDLNLKMSECNFLDVSQFAIESCGMERSFIACVLKLALRAINNKSRCNIIILDEIMGKLDSESVALMRDLFEKLKEKVQLLVIIEHTHPISYDYLIRAERNAQGVSSLTIEG